MPPKPKNDQPRISLDYTSISVVVTCTACPWWRGFALDRIEGWQVGHRHQTTHHPGTRQASLALHRALSVARKRGKR